MAISRESLQQLPLLISIAMVINGQWSSNLNIFTLILWQVAILRESLQQLPLYIGNHCNDDDRNLQILNLQETQIRTLKCKSFLR